MGMQGFAHSLIALRGQVKVIVHVLMGDATIGVDKAWVYIEEKGMREGRYGLLDQLVHVGISLPQRVWHFTPRQYTLENRFMYVTIKKVEYSYFFVIFLKIHASMNELITILKVITYDVNPFNPKVYCLINLTKLWWN